MRLFIILQQNVRYARTWAVFIIFRCFVFLYTFTTLSYFFSSVVLKEMTPYTYCFIHNTVTLARRCAVKLRLHSSLVSMQLLSFLSRHVGRCELSRRQPTTAYRDLERS